MKPFALIAAAAALLPFSAQAQTAVRHVAVPASAPSPAGPNPPYSAAVMAGDTLYVSGSTDGGPAVAPTAKEAAKRVLDTVKRSVEAGGLTMDDLVWVQVFSADLADYPTFNEVYRTYFKGPLPARAYLGIDHLLGGAKFEVMGIAVRPKK